MSQEPRNSQPSSARTTVRRGAKRAQYDRSEMMQILRDGTVAHVGVNTEDGPLVLPMVYGISGETMYLHGALANSLLKAGADKEICVTVTIVDGLVFAKTAFNHSMNYRSVVVRGEARVVSDASETLEALQVMTDHIVPTWNLTRAPSDSEIRATRVIALPLAEMSAKVRTGAAINEDEDLHQSYWSGYVPVTASFGEPVSNDDAGAEVPAVINKLVGTNMHVRTGL